MALKIQFESGIIRMGIIILALLISCHCIACFWVSMSLIDPRNWMVLKTVALVESGENIEMGDVWALYVLGLYMVTQTITTVGYGDVNPVNTLERVYVIGVMLVGVFTFGFISSALTSLMQHHDENVLQQKKTETILQAL